MHLIFELYPADHTWLSCDLVWMEIHYPFWTPQQWMNSDSERILFVFISPFPFPALLSVVNLLGWSHVTYGHMSLLLTCWFSFLHNGSQLPVMEDSGSVVQASAYCVSFPEPSAIRVLCWARCHFSLDGEGKGINEHRRLEKRMCWQL